MITIHNILNELKATSSSNDKIEIFKKHQNNADLKKLLKMAHNPEFIYGIKKIDGWDAIDEKTTMDNPSIDSILNSINKTLVQDKVRGHAARDHILELMRRVKPEYRYIINAVVNKDLKINAGVRLINKAIPGLLMDKHYMGAIPYNKQKVLELENKGSFYSQEKMDGMYANFDIQKELFMSRNLKALNLNIPELSKKIKPIQKQFVENGFPHVILNGELLIYGLSRYLSNGLLNSISKIEAKVREGQKLESLKEYKKIENEYGYRWIKDNIYMVLWDFIPYEDYNKGLWSVPYNDRFDILTEVLENKEEKPFLSLVATKKLNSLQKAMTHFKEIVAAGGEGTIVKSRDGFWKKGKPTYQIKLKFEMEVELKITGFKQGTPGTRLEHVLGAFEVESSDGLLVTRAPGINDMLRDEVWQNRSHYLGKIITVKCNGVSQDKTGKYSLLHPRFMEFREDKDQADSLVDIQRIEKSLLEA